MSVGAVNATNPSLLNSAANPTPAQVPAAANNSTSTPAPQANQTHKVGNQQAQNSPDQARAATAPPAVAQSSGPSVNTNGQTVGQVINVSA